MTFWASSRRGVPFLMAVVAAFAVSLCLARRAEAASPVPVIVDTDIYSNVDDVGALASAFALQKEGTAKVIAVTVNYPTADRSGVATDSWKCVAAIDNFYGSPNLPLGAGSPDDEPAGSSPYIGQCAQLAPASTPAPGSAVSVLRKALASQANDSVVMVEIGYEQNLEDLLKSPGDAISSLTGAQLVAQKVSELVVTGGTYPSSPTGNPETNFSGDPGAAQYVAANWPTEVVWSGDDVGDPVKTGYTISGTHPPVSPVRVAFEAFAGPGANISSYDPTTFYYALNPTDPSFTATGPGTNAIVDEYGDNTFTLGAGDQQYLSLTDPTDPTALESSIESLYDVLPSTGTISGTVDDASDNAPIGEVQVQAHDQLGNVDASAVTASDGTYKLSGLYGSNYTIDFVPAAGSNYQSYTDNGVALAGGASSTGVNAALTLPVPSNTKVPTFTGNAQAGQTLTEAHGSWTNSPTRYAYQWEDCSASTCSAIAGATSQSYTLTASDVGHAVRVEEFATNDGGTSVPAASALSAVVQGPPTQSTPPPSGSTPPPTTKAKVSSATIRGLLRSVLAAHGSRARIRALLRNDGYSFRFDAPVPGRLSIAWRQASRHGKKLLVARVSVVFHKSGRATIKLVLTRKGRTLLRGGHAVKISAQGSFTPKGSAATRATKSLRVKP
jgi:hypothetical protein